MADEKQAQELIEKAEKKLNSYSFFGFGGSKYEEASELYTRAANSYKMSKKWVEAASAFIESAKCEIQLQNKHEAATKFVSAANCYKKTNAKDAIDSLRKAVEIFTEIGRFNIAAKHQKEIAELYETELVDLPEAINAYQLAADWFSAEDSKSSANNCLLKVALFSAQLENYQRAIEIYEQIAHSSVDNTMLRWSVKDYLLKAGLCHLCAGDVIAAQRQLVIYCDMDSSFAATREYQFLKNIVEAVEQNNVEDFTKHVVEFDRITSLDNWKTTILLRIKRNMNEEPGLL